MPLLRLLSYYQIGAILNLPGSLFRRACQVKVEEGEKARSTLLNTLSIHYGLWTCFVASHTDIPTLVLFIFILCGWVFLCVCHVCQMKLNKESPLEWAALENWRKDELQYPNKAARGLAIHSALYSVEMWGLCIGHMQEKYKSALRNYRTKTKHGTQTNIFF